MINYIIINYYIYIYMYIIKKLLRYKNYFEYINFIEQREQIYIYSTINETRKKRIQNRER